MTIISANSRNNNFRGLGTIEGLLLAAIICGALYWSAGWVKASYFTGMGDAEAKKLAQEVVRMSAAAERVGLDLVDESSIEKTIAKVATGLRASAGSFSGQYFGIPQLKGKDHRKIARHLTFERGKLALNQAPSVWD